MLESVELSVDGDEHPVPKPEGVSIEADETVVLVDEVVSIGDGRPLELKRTFETIAETNLYSNGDEEAETRQTSDLEGSTVVFRWDAEQEQYEVEFEDEDGDEDLLEGLVEDMDMRGLLPAEEVALGDTWEVEVEVYKALMWPGGDLERYDEDAGEVDEDQQELNRLVLESLGGEATVTLVEILEEDGLRLALLELELEVEAGAELEIEGGDEGPESLLRAVALARTVSGQVLWNLDQGVLQSMSLEADSTMEFTERFDFEGPQGAVPVEQVMSYAGTVEYTIEFEVESP